MGLSYEFNYIRYIPIDGYKDMRFHLKLQDIEGIMII